VSVGGVRKLRQTFARTSVNSSEGGLLCLAGGCDSSELTEIGNPDRLWPEECHNILAQNV
jgi:hypothetical protein